MEQERKSLWRPILLAAVAVVLVLAVIWALTSGKNASAITAEEAIAAALADAGVAESETTALRCKAEEHDTVPHYEVEFYVGTDEYDYDIHAQTGAIISREVDRKEPQPAPLEETPVESTPTESTQNTQSAASTQTAPASRLTEDEALAIAYTDAGLTADQAERVKCALDKEDGRWVYDIEFHSGGREYDYEVHAETGTVLEKSVEAEK